MGMFSQGAASGINAGLNLMRNSMLRQRELQAEQERRDALTRIQEEQEARSQQKFDDARKLRQSQGMFTEAMLTGTVPDLMQRYEAFKQGVGPQYGPELDIANFAEQLPVNMMMNLYTGKYMTPAQKLGYLKNQETIKRNTKGPSSSDVTIIETKPPGFENYGQYAYNKKTGKYQYLGPPKAKSQMQIEVGEDGTIRFAQGTPQPGGTLLQPTTKTKSDVQAKLRELDETYDRLQKLKKGYKEEYLQMPYRFMKTMQTGFDKFGMLPKKSQQELEKYTGYSSEALDFINVYIHNMTGAQMSKDEANRLRVVPPDFGEHWWSGDSPGQFKGKVDRALMGVDMARARYNMYAKNGLNTDVDNMAKETPLDEMPKKIGDYIENTARTIMSRNPGIKPEDAVNQATAAASKYFGIEL